MGKIDTLKTKETLKKIIKVKTLIIGVVVNIALAYFCIKYYKNGELLFLKNQFSIFLCFVVLNFWLFLYLFYQIGELQNKNNVITDLLSNVFTGQNQILEELYSNKTENVLLHRNTQKAVSEFIVLQNEKMKSEEKTNDERNEYS